MENIVFTDIHNPTGVLEKPKPASEYIPQWYRDAKAYLDPSGKKAPTTDGVTPNATIKRCMPVFDEMTSGYTLYTYCDVYVSQVSVEHRDKTIPQVFGLTTPLTPEQIKERNLKPTAPHYEWPFFKPIGFHPVLQAPTHPGRGSLSDGMSYPKWFNPWSIKTPKGYSTLFTQPMHRESSFTILDGIVDTDRYTAPVNFPFVLNDWDFEGLIPAGTPMAQVIPFKRDSWKMEIGKEEAFLEQKRNSEYLLTSFFDSYKNKFRENKSYK